MNRLKMTAMVTLGLVLVPSVAQADEGQGWHTWKVPAGVTPYTVNDERALDGRAVGSGGFPQAYVGAGRIDPAECGVWYQRDLYKNDPVWVSAVLSDGVLDYQEDWGLTENWDFVYGGDCVEPPATPTEEPTSTPAPTTTPSSEPSPTFSEPTPTDSATSIPKPSGPVAGISVATTAQQPETLAVTGADWRLWALAGSLLVMGATLVRLRKMA